MFAGENKVARRRIIFRCLPPNIPAKMEHQTDVALSLSKHFLLKEAKDSNAVISPASIHALLSLIAAGSNGPTKDQLLSFLNAKLMDHLNSLSSGLVSLLADGVGGGPRLSFVNGVWVDRSLPLRQSFKQVAGNVYKAASSEVDFQNKAAEVATEVNEWAEKHTNGVIKEVLPPDAVDSMTRLVLGNALYFKGAWDQKFDPLHTKDHDFHLLNGCSVRVPFMTTRNKQYVSRSDGFKILSLPYKQGREDGSKRGFSMHIFLPDSRHGLTALVERAGTEPGFLSKHLPRRKVEVGEFRLPRFKLSFGFEASKTLKELGLVSSMFHKSFIEVNEEGTEAAAVSVAEIVLMCYVEPVKFVADHPFMFIIQEHHTGTVLFSGQILDPSQ
ncbi:unnamed protein product [Linum tenue]|uniref:Serpin domain-containing protein n=1 Tax=Linum tenue TaxID=586396 RepID=A0AAV0RLJ6_9ROSI|nr:unnamed protein product [Linum tenue]